MSSFESKPNGIYSQVNRAPTHHLQPQQPTESNQLVNEAAKGNVNHNNFIVNGSSTHSMSHYATHLNSGSEGIYGQTGVNHSQQYLFDYTHRVHPRKDSISDSVLSSNESPDAYQHHAYISSSIHYGSNHDRMNNTEHHNRSNSYSHRIEHQNHKTPINGFKSKNNHHSLHVSNHASFQCQNTSISVKPRPINNNNLINNTKNGRNDMTLSHSFDLNYAPRLVEDTSEVVEITPDQINSYSNNMSALQVRHGSEPTLSHSPTSISIYNLNNSQAIKSPGNSNTLPNELFVKQIEENSSKRWSTAVAVDHTLPSRLYSDQLVCMQYEIRWCCRFIYN